MTITGKQKIDQISTPPPPKKKILEMANMNMYNMPS